MMYAIAGSALESVAGQSWEELDKRANFRPLNMVDSVFSVEEFAAKPNHAKGYEQKRELPLDKLANIAPAGAINSNLPT